MPRNHKTTALSPHVRVGIVVHRQLDRRVIFHKASLTRNDYFEKVSTFAPWFTVAADYRETGADEEMQAKITAKIDAVFTIRWSERVAQITPDMRVSIGGQSQSFNITGIVELGRRSFVEIYGVRNADRD